MDRELLELFLGFTTDPDTNVNAITGYLGRRLGATYAVYNRLEHGALHSPGRWNTPEDYPRTEDPEDQISYDIIQRSEDTVSVLRDLGNTPYADSDPHVKHYNLSVYFGVTLSIDEDSHGCLYAAFSHAFDPKPKDYDLLTALASAIRIEERRRNQQLSLEESAEKYHAFIEQSVDNMFLLEPDTGKVVESNATFRTALGYSVEEMESVTVFDFIAHSAEDIREKIRSVIESERCYFGERKYRCKDGTLIDVEVNAGVVSFRGKRYIIVASRDIRDRKRLVSALKESEDRLRSIYNNASVGIISVDESGTFLDFNETWEGLIGYTGAELRSLSIDDVVDGTELSVFPLPVSGNKAEYRLERRFRRKDGTTFWGDMSMAILSGEDEHHGGGFICVIADISERRRIEDDLRLSESKYRTLTENLNVGVYRNTAGPEGEFIEANPAVARMFGYENRDDFLKMHVADLYENPQDRQALNDKLLREGSIHNEELHLRTRDGVPFIASVSAVAVPGTDGAISFFDGIIEDISERKRVEEELRRSEYRYRSTLDSMGDAIHVVDRGLRIVLFNKRFLEWNKSLSLDTDVIGKPVFEVFPFLPEHVKVEYNEVLEDRRTLVTEEIIPIDDVEFITETRKIPVIEEGTVVHIVTVIRDVTEQRRAVMALRESEERYRGLFDRAADLVYTMDLSGTFTNVNRAAFKHTGSTADELIGVHFLDFLCRQDRRKVIHAFRSIYNDRNYIQSLPITVRVKDGSLRNFEISVGPLIRHGVVVGFLGSARDITERLNAEKALRQSEERFRTMADLLPEVVFETDTEGTLTYVNRRGFALSGYTKSDFRRGMNAVELVIPEDRDRIRNSIKRIIAGEFTRDNEYTGVRKDGGHYPVLSRATRIVRDGKVCGLRGVLIDMTERHSLEEQLRHAAKMEAIGQLAGGIAHDFNNLLTGIVGYSSLMKMKFPSDSFGFEAGKTIERAAERATELTKQLLGFARRGKHQIVQVDVHKTIYDVVTLLSRTIDKNIRISLELTASPAVTSGDPGQIQQMLLNLAINARDAMPDGGDLRFATSHFDIESGSTGAYPELLPGEYIRISISDSGSGISEEIRDRIFEPFFTTKPKGEGTGMGLAMVYGIVRNHGGDVRMESEPGKGTIFEVLLPKTRGDIHEAMEDGDQVALRGSGTILLVDDEDVVRETSSAMLTELGYTVHAAKNGTDAIRLFKGMHEEIELVIVDLIMPDMNGRRCFRELKKINPEVTVLLSTGFSKDGNVQETIDEGIAGFIQKPYSMTRLATSVKNALIHE